MSRRGDLYSWMGVLIAAAWSLLSGLHWYFAVGVLTGALAMWLSRLIPSEKEGSP
jgi:hypothetical protein